MANPTATITMSTRKYCASLGTVTYGAGTKYPDGTWSTYRKMAVIAKYTETVVITRGLRSMETDAQSLILDTYDFIYGSTTDLKHAYFDYEYQSVNSECHRVSEAGFYEKTTVTRQCTDIVAVPAGNAPNT